jgi:hypothetical protein
LSTAIISHARPDLLHTRTEGVKGRVSPLEGESRKDCCTSTAPATTLPLGIGLDVGEAVPLGGGYRGAALNRSARLCGLAGPGEVLASREVVHLAGPLSDVSYEQRGAVQVKNLTEPVRVIQVAPVGDDPADRFALLAPSQAVRRRRRDSACRSRTTPP